MKIVIFNLLGELPHNKMKSLGKFNVEAKLRGVPNDVRLMNSCTNWGKRYKYQSKNTAQNIQQKLRNAYKAFYALASAYAESQKLKSIYRFLLGTPFLTPSIQNLRGV